MLTLRGHGSIGLPLYRIFPGVKGRLPLIDLANPDSNLLATTRAWLASVVFKYYLGERDDRFGRSRASASVQQVWNAGGDLLLSGRTNVSAKVKRVWEPVFMLGASYQVTRRFWITGMVAYIPLRTKITLDISQQNRTLASNTFDISANPVLATVLLNFRF
ncbi:hypothetical protein [Burkholderia ubonensis]|nr:hypothetical protein [Burkholderia ubonensis]KVU70119.1 hypothetical protein WK71_13025 [Burkholderia ubonensis]